MFSYPGHFVLNVQNGDKANTVELARFVSEAEANLALDFVLWMQSGFEHFNETPRQAVLSVMQYPGILAQNEFLATESKLEFEADFFANALADFLKGKDVARPLSIGFKGLVSLLGDLYGYQEYVIWDDICPKGDAFQLMKLIGQSKALTQDDLVAIGRPIFSVSALGDRQCALVFDDMHDGAFLFEQTWCKETFNLTLLHHSHSVDNAIDIAKRLMQQKVMH